MDYTANEKRLKTVLSVCAILLLAGSVLTAYLFIIHNRQDLLILLFTPLILLYLGVLAKVAAGGIRKNESYIDLLFISLLALGIYNAVRFFTMLRVERMSQATTIYGIYAGGSLLLLLALYLLWRSAVIARFNLHSLSPTQALAYRALAESVIGTYRAEGYSFDTTVTDFDDYLTRFQSPIKSQVKLVYLAIQFLPIFFFKVPLTWMGVEDRKKFIEGRFYGAKGLLLTIIRSAKQLVYFIYYGNKPSFNTIGYDMFEDRERFRIMPKEPEPKPLDVTYVTGSREIETDICVIGSGAAGAVAAYNLAKNTGRRVLILEKGRYYIPQKDFTNIEPQMIGTLYRDGGLEMTQDSDLAVLQGICVGGSTAINNGICFRTPPNILDTWEQLGAKIDRDKLEGYFTTVEEIIKAKSLDTAVPSITNEGANRFFAGATKEGLNPEWFVTNFGECGGCGYCNIGCKYNRKLSMLLNYLPMAQALGVQIVADAGVTKIETSGGRAGRIHCQTSDGTRFTVKAQHVVLAAGAIASSGLLLKSGIRRNVGTHLAFNITTPMMAQFPDKVRSFDGVQMCCYIKGNGYLVETTFNPPGASALCMQGWFDTLNNRMRHYPHFATAAPVVGSESNGTVKLDLFGNTTLDYSMTPSDFGKLKEGMKTVCRVFLSAGADLVLPASYDDLVVRSQADFPKIDALPKPESISLSTAHPQGGNPMSDNPDFGAVDTSFRVHGFSNLYVCDASVFPTGVTVNPQLSIMGLSTYAADIISANV